MKIIVLALLLLVSLRAQDTTYIDTEICIPIKQIIVISHDTTEVVVPDLAYTQNKIDSVDYKWRWTYLPGVIKLKIERGELFVPDSIRHLIKQITEFYNFLERKRDSLYYQIKKPEKLGIDWEKFQNDLNLAADSAAILTDRKLGIH